MKGIWVLETNIDDCTRKPWRLTMDTGEQARGLREDKTAGRYAASKGDLHRR